MPGFVEHELHGSKFLAGFMFGVFSGASVLARPMAPRLMRIFGRIGLSRIALLLQTIACFAYLSADAADAWLFLFRCLHGVVSGISYTTLFAVVVFGVPEARRTEGIALYGVSGIVPMSLGGVLGDYLIPLGGYSALFLASALAAGLGFVVSLALRSEPLSLEGHHGANRSLAQVFLDSSLVAIWPTTLLFAMALGAQYAFVGSVVDGIHAGSVGAFFLAYSIAAVCLRLFLGWVPEHFGRERILLPCLLSISCACFALANANGWVAIAVAGTFAGLGHGFAFPILSSLTAARARPGELDPAIAIVTALFDLGVLLSGPIFGFLLPHLGFSPVFVIAGALPMVGFVAYKALSVP